MKQLLLLPMVSLFWLSACVNNNSAPASADEVEAAPPATVDSVAGAEPGDAAPPPEQAESADLEAINPSAGSQAPMMPTMRAPAPPAPGQGRDADFADLTKLDPGIRLEIRYATDNNFTQSKIYDCPACLLRPEAARAIVRAQQLLQRKGMGLKMFDCYRPRPYQQRLWNKVPNPDYVTPPSKGSMHSRGAAVDLTIVDKSGNELDMGTPYDFFGPEAHTDNMKLPARVLANRRLLRETMEAVGFQGIRTEWWHFSFRGKNYPLSDYVWSCE